MRYWWVNQNQTARHEIGGGYLWSPKRNQNGARNPFYEAMRPKPTEFGSAGLNWELIGWRVLVRFTPLMQRIRPKEHMQILGPLLPGKYAPLQPNGNGIQSVYLTELPAPLAETMMALIGPEAIAIQVQAADQELVITTNADVEVWEQHLEQQVTTDTAIAPTDREAIVTARRGQGLFKDRVMQIERRCRITKVENPVHLRASHCKPWRDSDNLERLNGENGLLLTPSIDHLFDRGFISFENTGVLIISPVAHKPSLQRMGIVTEEIVNVGGFTEGQRHFLDYHRSAVLLRAVR